MNTGKTIRRFLFVSMWLVIASGMVILLAAAMRKQKNARCRDYSITIKSVSDNLFINEKDVEQILETKNSIIKGQPISSFNLNGMEQLLEKDGWVKDAELYFDNKDVLHIVITEREPLARIFTTAGNSFYIDDMAKRMSLSDKKSARVPVFTGFPEKKNLDSKDSLLLNDVKTVAQFIYHDPFWMAQAAQVDITPERNFEMMPLVGNHVIRLGNGENLDQKFHRLFVFYKEVLSKTGFDKYKTIDVQYDGQVVASKQKDTTKVDIAQLRKNVDKLLKEAKEAQLDTITSVMLNNEDIQPNNQIPEKTTTESRSVAGTNLKATDKKNVKAHDPNAMKTNSVSDRSIEKPKTTDPKPEEKKIPKAVMPKKDVEKDKQ